MRLQQLHSYQTRVGRMFDAYSDLPEIDEIRANWARYLCVQVAGLMEAAVRTYLIEFTRNKSEKRVLNYVERELEFFTNAKCEKIEILLGSFSKHWSDSFVISLSDEEKDAINSIIGNRHQIAHGRDIGLTYVRVKTYYGHASRVLDRLEVMIKQSAGRPFGK